MREEKEFSNFFIIYIDTYFKYWYNEASKEGDRCIKLMKLEQ